MPTKIILVTGGARSGKSLFAERYAAACGTSVAYIATAQIYDDEMKERVKLHQRRRPAHWLTWEAPLNAHEAVFSAGQKVPTILFDCLTLYTTNLLLASEGLVDREERFAYVMEQADKLFASAAATGNTIIFVTNEVGMGIVPDNALAREYRDLAGVVNQKAAAVADEVYLAVCGIAVDIKKLAFRPEKV